ncbi:MULTISPECIES: type III secretion system translocon subunit AopD [Aeromonas]|uniref:type III secretion system translocon subunit AopD n=1 Tax=Aeromonas TaxID=642 RepID=UPI00037F5733|nr:type III secretion system translocon subunit AopD [Aeromonas dhakensis]MBL0533288.1 type III secretion system translocon subunit AopD [Aeromonas dhakensis]MBL0675783.1 type III secretion system translocon subunit AopD [Aeromonas dhakensis]MCJ2367973.1 type III secretion system translocon subunit AopD [Aeromonas dhakensis]MDH0175255.1 type III secretion system translocon subunit AopD [Aeromonas dhakensis]MDH0345956.1 type III secretion system translocon subunit AopD [Aeromonas dhakensis]
MINSDYANGVNHTSLLPEMRTGESQQVRHPETIHEAAGSGGQRAAENKSLPVLPRPSVPFDTKGVTQMTEQLESVMDMMSLLFKLARQAREMGLVQRDTENKLVIGHQQAQVDEMRHGAMLMIATAVVSGVMAVASAVMGGFSMAKSAKTIKQDKALNANIAGRQQELKQIGDIKKTAGLEMGDAGQDLTARIKNDKAALLTLNKKFDANNSRQQLAGTVTQSVGQMSNSAVQVSQGTSQAEAKEDEVKATISQAEKQKIEDNMSFNVNFMKDVLQLMQQYAQSQNQAWKAAFGVA